MSSKLDLYWNLPYPVKVIAASLHGWLFQRRRYGPDTERLVEEAIDRERWSLERWRLYQEDKLARLLHRAATKVPYYRDQWARLKKAGIKRQLEMLEHWPILEKDDLRSNPRAFLADDSPVHKLYRTNTSGTTGKSITLWWSLEMTRRWYALFEARWRRWHGVSIHNRWAILGGRLITPVSANKPPFWVWNAPMHQLYMSAYHLSPRLVPYYCDALRQHRIEYLWGYTSALVALAHEVLRLDRRDLAMKVVLTNAEPLMQTQREVLEQAFQCPVRETYGMAEAVTGAGECDCGSMHFWPESGVLEAFRGDEPLRAGEVGDLVATGLINEDMPLIRYRVGDRGSVPVDKPCSCGRSLPILPPVEGRCDDVLRTRDGRLIGRLDPVFKENLAVREAQIVQETLDRIRVRFVPAEGYTDLMGDSIRRNLLDRMGDVDVVLEMVDAIPRSANGKFKAVISMLPRDSNRPPASYALQSSPVEKAT